MKKILFFLIVFSTLGIFNIGQELSAQEKKKSEKKEKREAVSKKNKKAVRADKVIEQTVYMFGFANEMGDSVYYITDIHEIPAAKMLKRQKFLLYRDSYGIQLKQHLEGNLGHLNQTVAIMFSTNRKSLEKTMKKVRKSTLKNDKASRILSITREEFKFEKVGVNTTENNTKQ